MAFPFLAAVWYNETAREAVPQPFKLTDKKAVDFLPVIIYQC
jgi:hypothetical protein